MFRNLPFIKFTVLVVTAVIVGADDCRKMCGTIAPNTAQRIHSCAVAGFTRNLTTRIDWSDGSHSEFIVALVTQLSIGSCCFNIIYPQYATGIVTVGRFSGEPVTYVETLRNKRTACNNGCETISGMSSITSSILLSIGTKGVGQWIECSGTYVLFSPPLTSNPQYASATISGQLSDCSNYVESC